MTTRLVIGCMTGTSCDGLDVALLRCSGRGLDLQAQLLDSQSRSLGTLGGRLRQAADQQPLSAGEWAQLARDLAELHVEVIRSLPGHGPIDLVVVHGQTVFHRPPLSWQMIDAAHIAHSLGLPVCFDLRAADLAGGGQGAPITPLADLVLFGCHDEHRCIVNLGGFCNLTMLPAGRDPASLRGGDIAVCNQLLDRLARERLGEAFDPDGAFAASGSANPVLASRLQALFDSEVPRSLGTGDERVDGWLAECGELSTPDLLATICSAVAMAVIDHCDLPRDHVDRRLVLAGGGAANRALASAIAEEGIQRGWTCCRSDHLGVPAELREAACMAVLGCLAADGVPITLPQITGAPLPRRAGSWIHPQGPA
jgi:1,6-anhydro-N-acetylmuramate kinase